VQRATVVVQLDAGLEMTGVADDGLLRHLSIDGEADSRRDETRQIGTSSTDRPIMAMRYGDRATTALVVGQTYGDEEAGRRVQAIHVVCRRRRAGQQPDVVTPVQVQIHATALSTVISDG
jgi:hypothetical protein